MPTQNCAVDTATANYNKPLAQTLFLGASVSSFSANMGWGGQPSSVTVTLLEDVGCSGIPQFKDGGGSSVNDPNHYYTCSGDSCYVDEEGRPYTPDPQNPSKMRLIPGKVYYEWDFDSGKGFVSKYWRRGDPGFLATGTSLDCSMGTPTQTSKEETSSLKVYDIVGTPVYFKMQNFSFAGLVQSWERDISSGGSTYRVTIEGPDNILNNSWLIIGDYAGTVFYRNTTGTASQYGGPINGSLNSWSGLGTLAEGALHNVFNVYGFLESFGVDYFGPANLNDNGLKANTITEVLKILTSSIKQGTGEDDLDILNKNRFSPFGRLLVKALQKESDLTVCQLSSFGVIPAYADKKSKNRCQCILDLKELPQVPDDFRISGSVISVMDFVRQVTDEAGYDFYWEMIPAQLVRGQQKIVSVLKLHTVSRRFQPSTSIISRTIKQYADSGVNIASATLGKESSSSNVRSLLFGPHLQRLYQAKNYRLSYKQASYIYEPMLKKFIDYAPLGSNDIGKTRMPSGYSQRNPDLSVAVLGADTTAIVNMSEELRPGGERFNNADPNKDEPWGSATNEINYGNYDPIKKFPSFNINPQNRFIPLYEDIICPFFGYQNEDNVELSTGEDSNVFARIRPVWFDTWSGQINVAMYVAELPVTNIPLTSLYGSFSAFSITESEMRCAMVSSQEYLIYCLEKTYKPDLFVMLVAAYRAAGQPIVDAGYTDDAGNFIMNDFNSWAAQPNAAGPLDVPVEASPDQGDIGGGSFDIFLHPNFLRDFEIIHSFVAGLGSKYYGKKYLVKMPLVRAYKDQQYFQITNPNEQEQSNPFHVYKGSGKIFYNYEPCEEAWEEQGNIIDDTIVVGSVDYFRLANDNGCIPALIGYNASDQFDRIHHFMASIPDVATFVRYLGSNAGGQDGSLHQDLLVQWQAAKAANPGADVNKSIFPGLDISGLQSRDYLVKKVVSHPDAFGITIPGVSSTTKMKNPAAPATPELAKKLYVKTNAENGFAFLYPDKLDGPRVIIEAPGLSISTGSLSYEVDPNNTIIANVSIEDLGIYYKAVMASGGDLDENFVRYLLHYCSPVFGGQFLKGNPFNISSKFPAMTPKAAHPCFAAIPIKSRIFSYGPWTNYTDFIKEEIFPDYTTDQATNGIENLIGGVKVDLDPDLVPWNYGSMSLLDKVAFTKIQDNANYQPVGETGQIQTPGLPIFGIGSKFNFRASPDYNNTDIIHNNIVYTIGNETITYTDKKESSVLGNLPPIVEEMFGGRIVNPVPPTYTETNIAYTICYISAPDEPYAPIISSISISFGRDITTSYSFRTHTRKLSLFNKVETDRLKQNALNNIKRNKQIANIATSASSAIDSQRKAIQDGLKSNQDYTSISKISQKKNKFYDWSPCLVMVGGSYPFIPNQFIREYNSKNKDKASKTRDKKNNSPDKVDKINSVSLRYGKDPGDDAASTADFEAKPIETLYKLHRRRTFVGSYQPADAKMELSRGYESKSVMTMDGLFSPVSFYPTWGNSTYHMSIYDYQQCPYCSGTHKIKQDTFDYSKAIKKPGIEYKCPYCGVITLPKGTTKTQLKKSAETLPPYIVASGTDISTLLSMESSDSTNSNNQTSTTSQSEEGVEIPINMFSLQPIIVPYGNFRNPNAEKDSRCRHSIQIVARGSKAPRNDAGFSIFTNIGDYYLPDGKQTKESGKGYNIDFSEYDYAAGNASRLMNHRFIGLRGPLMLHAWGYDSEGYPVPNAADEPKEFDSEARPKRFVLKITKTDKKYSDLDNGDTFEFPVNSNKKYTKKSTPGLVYDTNANPPIFREITDTDQVTLVEVENDPASDGKFLPGDNEILGDIIGKGWSKEGGKWVKKKSNKFYKDWGERPDIWPVGPIDLRWDESRKVWTTASNDTATMYKMVYVTLEEDMVKEDYSDETYPARAFLDDTEYSTDPLDQHYRRLVLVKDKAGYTAPRGAKLLCRYDQSSGFYEPVSKPSYVVTGIINNGTQATLEMAYVQGKKRGEINPTMLVSFENPFAFNIISGNHGLFTFNASRWILMSTKETLNV